MLNRLSLKVAMLTACLLASNSMAQAQVYTSDKAGLVDAVHDYKIGSWWESILVDRTFDFQLSPGCWQKFVEKDGWGIKTVSNSASSVGAYIKAKDWGDLEAAESMNNNDRTNNKPRIEEMINEVKPKLHFTLVANSINCTDAEWDLLHRFWSTVFEALEDGSWKPKYGEIYLTFTMSPTAKDIAVSVNPDGKHFSITAPARVEPDDWSQKIVKGLNRVPSSSTKPAPRTH